MTAEGHLAEIVAALEAAGLRLLVMGGHAVRYYGVTRNTVDFDLHLASDAWHDLAQRLAAVPLFRDGVSEGNSWRPHSFRRFQVGRLPDGREEWFDFWRGNHLLAPFEELFARREVGEYGGRPLPFRSLPDLIRSKETERADDWRDVALLEELLDTRHHVAVARGRMSAEDGLTGFRSRVGLSGFLTDGRLADAPTVAAALRRAAHPVTAALLLPFAPAGAPAPATAVIEPVVLTKLRGSPPAGPLHLALVEVVRRQYRADREQADRADKVKELSAATLGPPSA